MTLNGNDHVISGLNVTTENNNTPAGLFGFLVNSQVHNLFLKQPAVLSTGNGSPAGAVVGEMDNSNVTNIINHLGKVKTEGGLAGSSSNERYSAAGGLVGWAKKKSRVENTLNTGAVSTIKDRADAGGAVGYAGDSWVSDTLNLNDDIINATQANEGSQTGSPVNNNALPVPVNGLNGLSETLWTAGNDGQFPMLIDINAAYQDLKRIDGTRYGNNTFPPALDDFALPSNDTSESLFDPRIWNLREGYLPFLKSVGLARAEAAGIDCSEGGFACDCDPETDDFCVEATTETTTTEAATTEAATTEAATEPITTSEVTTEPTTDSTCLFTDQSPGTIEHLLYDGQRYHAVVKTNSGGAYWATYEKDGSVVPLGFCGVYDFTDLLLSGTDLIVDAVIHCGDSVYVASHAPETQSPMLAMLTLLNGQPSSVTLLESPDNRVVSLSVDESVLVNTGQAVYGITPRLSWLLASGVIKNNY